MNIVDIIRKQVDLKKIGEGIYRGLCPFHEDTSNPNFTVYEKTNSYYCFACGIYGTLNDWIREMEDDEFLYDFKQKTNYNDWRRKNSILFLALSDELRKKRKNKNLKIWKKELNILLKLLRRQTDEKIRTKIRKKYFKEKNKKGGI